jgi:hypothetical protein
VRVPVSADSIASCRGALVYLEEGDVVEEFRSRLQAFVNMRKLAQVQRSMNIEKLNEESS